MRWWIWRPWEVNDVIEDFYSKDVLQDMSISVSSQYGMVEMKTFFSMISMVVEGFWRTVRSHILKDTSGLFFLQADVSNVGAFDWAMDLSSFDEQVDVTSHRQVPQISSAPTMSGFFCSSRVEGSAKGNLRQEAALLPDFSSAFVVPDVDLCSPSTSRPLTKRSRTQYDMWILHTSPSNRLSSNGDLLILHSFISLC